MRDLVCDAANEISGLHRTTTCCGAPGMTRVNRSLGFPHLRCATIALHGATGRCRASRLPSHVEEDGLVLALHVYVEAIEAILLSLSDERTAPFRRNEGEHR